MDPRKLKALHRRDRAALVLLRLGLGLAIFEAGVQMLRSSWGAIELAAMLQTGLQQAMLAPELEAGLNVLMAQADWLAQVIVLLHLIGGLLLAVGLLTHSSALCLGLLYTCYCVIWPATAPMLLALGLLALALSDAGQTLSLQRYARVTQPSHQSTDTN